MILIYDNLFIATFHVNYIYIFISRYISSFQFAHKNLKTLFIYKVSQKTNKTFNNPVNIAQNLYYNSTIYSSNTQLMANFPVNLKKTLTFTKYFNYSRPPVKLL